MREIIVNIDVPNLDDAIRFYEQGLGFALQRTLFGRTVAELSAGKSTVYLIEKQEGTKPIPDSDMTRTFVRHWTPVHIDILVDNIEAAVSRTLNAGALPSGEQASYSWGKIAPLSDPFGHGVCLVEFSAEGYDRVAD